MTSKNTQHHDHYHDDDDEDETESSIFDLIHAPQPPSNMNHSMNISSSSFFGHSSSRLLGMSSGSHLLPPHHPKQQHRSLSPPTIPPSPAPNNMNASISNLLLSSNSATTNNNNKSLTQMLLRRNAAIAGGGDNLASSFGASSSSVTSSQQNMTPQQRLYSSAQNLSYNDSRSELRRHSSFSPSTPRSKSIFGMNRNSLANLSMLGSSSNPNEELTYEILRRRHNSADGTFFPVLDLGATNSKDNDDIHHDLDGGRENSLDFDEVFGPATGGAPSLSSSSSMVLRGSKKKTRLEQLSASTGLTTETGSKENNDNNLGNKSPNTNSKKDYPKKISRNSKDDEEYHYDDKSPKMEPINITSPSVERQQQQQKQPKRPNTPLPLLPVTIDNAPPFQATPKSNKKKKEKRKGRNKENTSSTNPNTSSNTSEGRSSGILSSSFSNLFSSITRRSRSKNDTSGVPRASLVERNSMLHTPNMDLIEGDNEDDADDTTKKTDFQSSYQLEHNSMSTVNYSGRANNNYHNSSNTNNDNSNSTFMDQSSSHHQNHSSFQSESTVTNNLSNTLSYNESEDGDVSSVYDHDDHDIQHPDYYDPNNNHEDNPEEEITFYDDNHQVKNSRSRRYSTDLNRSDCIIVEEDDEEEEEETERDNDNDNDDDDDEDEEEKTEVENNNNNKDETETSEYSLNSIDYDIYGGQSNNAVNASKFHQSVATDMNHYLGSHSNLDYEFDDDDDDHDHDRDGQHHHDDDDDSDDSDNDSNDSSTEEDDNHDDDEEYQRKRPSNFRKSKRGSLPLVSRIGSKKFGQSSSSLLSNDSTPGTPGRHHPHRGSFPRTDSFNPDGSCRQHGPSPGISTNDNNNDRRVTRDRRSSASTSDIDDYDNDDDSATNDLHNRNSFPSARQQSSTLQRSSNSRRSSRKKKRPTILGWEIPKWLYWLLCCCCSFALDRIDYRCVASVVVTKLPCFWFVTTIPYTRKAILGRLNLLSAILAAMQVATCCYLYICMFAQDLVDRNLVDTTNVNESAVNDIFNTSTWNQNGAILILGMSSVVLMITNVLNIRVIRSVDISGALRYLWILSWILPIQTFFVLQLFDYYQVTHVWVQFAWRDSTMAMFRHYFCAESTANTLCAVPIFDNELDEIEWCETKFNATNCSSIRESAQEQTENFLWIFFTCCAVWGCLLIALIFLTIKILEGIISVPLVIKSREAQIPSWLLLPTISCAAVGCIFSFSNVSVLNISAQAGAGGEVIWIGPMYIVGGGMFFIGACLGWFMSAYTILNTRDKWTKSIAILTFISLMGTLLIMMTVIFVTSVVYSISLGQTQLSNQRRGEMACYIDQGLTCTGCDELFNRCPEWEDSDLRKVLQTQAKSSATLAIICVVYAIIALRYGFNARKNLSMYQIEYV